MYFYIENFLPYILTQAAEAVSTEFQSYYKKKYGILRTEWRVLFHLGSFGQMTARDIGIRAKTPNELDEKIKEMINVDKPVIFDCVVDKAENCFPMIPSGKPHNQMILGPEEEEEISDEGKILV